MTLTRQWGQFAGSKRTAERIARNGKPGGSVRGLSRPNEKGMESWETNCQS